MDEELPNLLRTAPIRRRVDQGLTAFILAHITDLRARRIAGERAEDILPLVEQMLGRSIKLVTFASLLSRHVPIEPKSPRSDLKFEAPQQPSRASDKPALRQRAREPPPPPSREAGSPVAGSHTEQPGIVRPIKPKIFISR